MGAYSRSISSFMICSLFFACAGCDGSGRWTTRPDSGEPGQDAETATDAAPEAAARDAAPDGPTPGADATSGDASADGDAEMIFRDAAFDGPRSDATVNPRVCAPEDIVPAGCVDLGEESEASAGLCDGLDNNCNGQVDEHCLCTPGDVQPCFVGPPGRAGVGACHAGMQTCEGFEFAMWNECVGGVGVAAEQCDGIDNDCNGCVDEIDRCTSLVDCPVAGDPRVPDGRPFSTYTFDADRFVDPSVVERYRWRVQGTPCDRMFQKLRGGANSRNGKLSYTLRHPTSAQPSIDLTLSGEYTVTMAVDLVNGESVSCVFPLKVGAHGLRVELCWPESGPNAADQPHGEIDLDLHLGRADITEQWNDDEDCHHRTCKVLTQQPSQDGSIWDHNASGKAACIGAVGESVREYVQECPNPRLDADSATIADERYPVENINLDNPRNRQSFRVAVVHNGCEKSANCGGRAAHPLVNVYCDAELSGSFRLPEGEIDTFGDGNVGLGASNQRDLWRVVDIATSRPGGNLSCDLTALTAPDTSAPWIETGGTGGSLPY